jgi:hypothetical protein
MEPLNCVVDLQADKCTMWAGSQFQTGDQAAIAATAGLKPEQVTEHDDGRRRLWPARRALVGLRGRSGQRRQGWRAAGKRSR